VKKYNETVLAIKSESQLKSDIDYVHRKIQKLHPRLDWYISKSELDYKFDSLKSTITSPMTSNEFFFKISPVVSSVRQGHMRMHPVTLRLTKKESKALNRKGTSPLNQLSFEVFDNKLYIVGNSSPDTTIRVGTEIVAMNGVKPQEIFTKFNKTFTSDGYNTTFYNRFYPRLYPNFFYTHTGERDSIQFELSYRDTLTNVVLKRDDKKTSKSSKKSVEKSKEEKKIAKANLKKEGDKRKFLGFNPTTKLYSKNLSFFEPDSSIAYLKINDFSRGKEKQFYKKTFEQLDYLDTKTLIIDLRGNPGGRLNEISNLFSYLADTSFTFVDKMEVTTRTSYVLGGYSRSTPVFRMALNFTIGLPFVISQLLRVTKDNGKFYFKFKASKVNKPKPNNFSGKVYVLINGGSFSASSILSSNLKGTKRAIFVGEETGGAYNGCVAGRMPSFTLPESKLRIQLGLGVVAPFHKSPIEGRGIFPDVEIIPTIEDRILGKDPELDWILNEIKQPSIKL
jgi:C-terminal processing protease CtpA/Prc